MTKYLFVIIALLPLMDVNNYLAAYWLLFIVMALYLVLILSKNDPNLIIHPIFFISIYFYASLMIGDYVFSNDLIMHETLSREIIESSEIDKDLIIKIYIILISILNYPFLKYANSVKYTETMQVDRKEGIPKKISILTQLPWIFLPLLPFNIYVDTSLYSGYITHYISIYFCYSILLIFNNSKYFLIISSICTTFILLKFYGDKIGRAHV